MCYLQLITTNLDDENEEFEEVLPVEPPASSSTPELGKLYFAQYLGTQLHIHLGPPSCIARMQFRDPEGHFSVLSSLEKIKLIYRSDLGIYGPNNEDVGFDSLPDVLVPGRLVIIDANLF